MHNDRVNTEEEVVTSAEVDRLRTLSASLAAENILLKQALEKAGIPIPRGNIGNPDTEVTETVSSTAAKVTSMVQQPVETDDQLREENEIMDELLKTAGVRLTIHTAESESGRGWRHMYDRSWKPDSSAKDFSGRHMVKTVKDWLYANDHMQGMTFHHSTSDLMQHLTGKVMLSNMEHELVVMGPAGWSQDKSDRNMDHYLEQGSPNEEAYFYIHTVPVSNYKYDPRPGIVEMISVIPETVARKLYIAIKKNPAFRERVLKELMKDRFPKFKNYEEGNQYGKFYFRDNFELLGPKGGQFEEDGK